MLERFPRAVRGVFIHDVTARDATGDGRAKAEYEALGIRFYTTYVGAATAALEVRKRCMRRRRSHAEEAGRRRRRRGGGGGVTRRDARRRDTPDDDERGCGHGGRGEPADAHTRTQRNPRPHAIRAVGMERGRAARTRRGVRRQGCAVSRSVDLVAAPRVVAVTAPSLLVTAAHPCLLLFLFVLLELGLLSPDAATAVARAAVAEARALDFGGASADAARRAACLADIDADLSELARAIGSDVAALNDAAGYGIGSGG